MTSLFDQNALLNAKESRIITLPDGQRQSVTMTRAGWTSFDDLAAGEFFDAETLIDYADHLRGKDSEKNAEFGFGYWIEHSMMRVQERQRQDEQSLAEFNRFCARQPRNNEGLRRIEEKAQRMKAERAARNQHK